MCVVFNKVSLWLASMHVEYYLPKTQVAHHISRAAPNLMNAVQVGNAQFICYNIVRAVLPIYSFTKPRKK